MSRSQKASVFLKDCIADALIEKMQEKPFEKITIDELAASAGVGRATYFRHFQSKQEVLSYKIIRHWEINAEKRNLTERSKFDIANATDFFEINYLLRPTLDAIYAAKQQSALYDAFCKIMLPAYAETSYELYRERFYAYGLFGVLDEWILRGYRESPKVMAETLVKIVESTERRPK